MKKYILVLILCLSVSGLCGTNVTISTTMPVALESSTNLINWSFISNVTSNINVLNTGPKKFFRGKLLVGTAYGNTCFPNFAITNSVFLCGTNLVYNTVHTNNVLSYIITLAWDSSVGATGYKIYYGPTTQIYDHALDVGNCTNVILNVTWYPIVYFAATAYNILGMESMYSDEISFAYTRAPVLTIR
jgi:hypothetical protein